MLAFDPKSLREYLSKLNDLKLSFEKPFNQNRSLPNDFFEQTKYQS